MPCQSVTLSDGSRAIVCGSAARRQRCACGNWATLLCDWTGPAKGPTCDAPICTRCATAPAVGKDLCRTHAAAYREWQAPGPDTLTTLLVDGHHRMMALYLLGVTSVPARVLPFLLVDDVRVVEMSQIVTFPEPTFTGRRVVTGVRGA